MVINAILIRAENRQIPQAWIDMATDSGDPSLTSAICNAPIDKEEAIRLIREIVGDEKLACDILSAHAKSGYGSKGHRRLGI